MTLRGNVLGGTAPSDVVAPPPSFLPLLPTHPHALRFPSRHLYRAHPPLLPTTATAIAAFAPLRRHRRRLFFWFPTRDKRLCLYLLPARLPPPPPALTASSAFPLPPRRRSSSPGASASQRASPASLLPPRAAAALRLPYRRRHHLPATEGATSGGAAVPDRGMSIGSRARVDQPPPWCALSPSHAAAALLRTRRRPPLGWSEATLLGEATVNLAEYANAFKLLTVTLALLHLMRTGDVPAVAVEDDDPEFERSSLQSPCSSSHLTQSSSLSASSTI
ncbi:uncharacterized protein LOC133900210 [Phragmites australis]|uniref:uncharacterized protein LOC133900210 n=1 Tax=Phragmites australis TaxID=29695 RepID=UPI002D79A976|nr:uncharacterized protein LOC133900210 [Phragmites australis]